MAAPALAQIKARQLLRYLGRGGDVCHADLVRLYYYGYGVWRNLSFSGEYEPTLSLRLW